MGPIPTGDTRHNDKEILMHDNECEVAGCHRKRTGPMHFFHPRLGGVVLQVCVFHRKELFLPIHREVKNKAGYWSLVPGSCHISRKQANGMAGKQF